MSGLPRFRRPAPGASVTTHSRPLHRACRRPGTISKFECAELQLVFSNVLPSRVCPTPGSASRVEQA